MCVRATLESIVPEEEEGGEFDFVLPTEKMSTSELSVLMDDVHVVYNASTGPLGVAFVILLLHESTSSTMPACCA